MLNQMNGFNWLATKLCPDESTIADASLSSAAGMLLADLERCCVTKAALYIFHTAMLFYNGLHALHCS